MNAVMRKRAEEFHSRLRNANLEDLAFKHSLGLTVRGMAEYEAFYEPNAVELLAVGAASRFAGNAGRKTIGRTAAVW